MIASRAPRVSGESQGRVTWGIPGAWPYAYSGPGQQSVTTLIS